MSIVTLADAKARLSELVGRAAQGEAVSITRRGKTVAQLTAVDRPRKAVDLAALRQLTDSMPPQPSLARDWMRDVRDQERY